MTTSENSDVKHDHDETSSVERPRGRPPGFSSQRTPADSHLVSDLIQVLQAYPSGRRRWSVMKAIRSNYKDAGRSIPHQIEGDVQRAFLENCADTDSFKKRRREPELALFYRPQAGVADLWAVRSDRVADWQRGNI